MKYLKSTKITQCFMTCPFYGSAPDGMMCNHPHFDNSKYPWDKMIISQENSRGRVPDECPLITEGSTDFTIRVELDK